MGEAGMNAGGQLGRDWQELDVPILHPSPLATDLNWIHVQDAEEAWKLLKVGRKNQSFASTHLNQNSSRR